MKYLFLSFKNAGLFRESSRSRDRILEGKTSTPRSGGLQYVAPITGHQVSNMLHVLVGERPVPSLRKTSLTVNKEIFDLANKGYLKITTPKVKMGDRDPIYPENIIKTAKSVSDSTRKPDAHVYWERIRKLIGDELNYSFITLLTELLGSNVRRKYTAIEARNKIMEEHSDNHKIIAFKELLTSESLKSLTNWLDGKDNAIDSNPKVLIRNNSGVANITKLRGEIIIPLTEHYADKISKGGGVATILDDGLVVIEDIIDEDDMYDNMLEGFTLISEISKKTKKIKNN